MLEQQQADMNDDDLQQKIDERQQFVDIWRAVHTLTLAKRKDQEQQLQHPRWPYSGDELELYVRHRNSQADSKLSKLLA